MTLGLGMSLSAQEVAAYKTAKTTKAQQMQSAIPCGIVEHDACLARGCECAMGGVLEVDFLWWRAENPGFTYGFDIKDPHSTAATSATTGTYQIGSLMQLESKWDPGFRIGMGWNTCFDRWDVFTDWTWYSVTSEETSTYGSTPVGEMGYHSLWPVSSNADAYQQVEAGWKMWYNAIDMELGRAFYITKALSLRTHAGLRGAWLNQKFQSQFEMPVAAIPNSKMTFHGENEFWGVGPRIGFSGNWHIDSSEWSILCKASGALLSGKTETRSATDYLVTVGGVATPQRDMRSNFTQIVPTVQFFLGIDWGTCFDCNKYYLGLNAGWEANLYWNQFSLLPAMKGYFNSPIPSMSNQAVMMDGLTFNAHLDF